MKGGLKLLSFKNFTDNSLYCTVLSNFNYFKLTLLFLCSDLRWATPSRRPSCSLWGRWRRCWAPRPPSSTSTSHPLLLLQPGVRVLGAHQPGPVPAAPLRPPQCQLGPSRSNIREGEDDLFLFWPVRLCLCVGTLGVLLGTA